MKLIKRIIPLALIISILTGSVAAFAANDSSISESGAGLGISEGISLPKTTEQLLLSTQSKKNQIYSLKYKEILFLSGQPVEVEGMLNIRSTGTIPADKDVGTYKETYTFMPLSTAGDTGTNLYRNIVFNVNYRKVKTSGVSQVILDYNVSSWSERITGDAGEYTLDPKQSKFERSIIRDVRPGVTYYKGNLSQTAVYRTGEEGNATKVESSGPIYGYESAWSKTETSRIDVTVLGADGWQLEAQVRPSVSVAKSLQYSPNEPTAISFDGNYYEVTNNQSVLTYDIFVMPLEFERGVEKSGSFNIANTNRFEQLPAPDLAFLKGHFAESDIKKLFAMQVLDGEPKHFQPAQAITRGQFIMALTKALKLPIEEPKTKGKKVVTYLFPDLQDNRQDFYYIKAAYDAGLVAGRYDVNKENYFRPDESITREEAVVIMIRAIGLENLGLDPTPFTPFTDDKNIHSWAKREVSAANTLGIVAGDADGNFNPLKKVSKAEGAALINRIIDYMRYDIRKDYVEHIVNYSK